MQLSRYGGGDPPRTGHCAPVGRGDEARTLAGLAGTARRKVVKAL